MNGEEALDQVLESIGFDEDVEDYPESEDVDPDLVETFDTFEDIDPDFMISGEDIAEGGEFGEGNRRERANAARSIRNAKAIKVNSRRITSNYKSIRSLRRAHKLLPRRYLTRKRYYRDERRERRALAALAAKCRSIADRLDEQEQQAFLQSIMALFAGRIQSISLSDGQVDAAENPADTFTVVAQQNDMIGTLLPLIMPMMTGSSSGKKNDMMLPLMLVMAMQQGAFGGAPAGGAAAGGFAGGGALLLMLPLLMMRK